MTRTRAILAVLFAGAFVMGTAEMLVVGLIEELAADLRVTVADAGALVTANALGLALGGPALTLATARLDRRLALLLATAAFVLVNVAMLLTASLPLILAARVAAGAAQGLFIAAGITTATAISPPERAGRAMAVVISGFASASAFGLPLGTLLGQAVGWRGAFVVVVAAAGLVLVAAAALLPRVPADAVAMREHGATGQAGAPDTRPRHPLRQALAPRVLLVLAVGAVMFTGIQAALTYLVPYLTGVVGVGAPLVSTFLLAYGVATTLGSALGGRFADDGAGRTMILGTAGVTLCLAALAALGLAGGPAPLVALAVLGIGLCGMGIAPSLQHRVVTLAGSGGAIAASLPSSAVNVGIALGALIGGMATTARGPVAPSAVGAMVAAGAVALAWLSHRRAAGRTPGPAPAVVVPYLTRPDPLEKETP